MLRRVRSLGRAQLQPPRPLDAEFYRGAGEGAGKEGDSAGEYAGQLVASLHTSSREQVPGEYAGGGCGGDGLVGGKGGEGSVPHGGLEGDAIEMRAICGRDCAEVARLEGLRLRASPAFQRRSPEQQRPVSLRFDSCHHCRGSVALQGSARSASG